jgi:hypothetical protein
MFSRNSIKLALIAIRNHLAFIKNPLKTRPQASFRPARVQRIKPNIPVKHIAKSKMVVAHQASISRVLLQVFHKPLVVGFGKTFGAAVLKPDPKIEMSVTNGDVRPIVFRFHRKNCFRHSRFELEV